MKFFVKQFPLRFTYFSSSFPSFPHLPSPFLSFPLLPSPFQQQQQQQQQQQSALFSHDSDSKSPNRRQQQQQQQQQQEATDKEQKRFEKEIKLQFTQQKEKETENQNQDLNEEERKKIIQQDKNIETQLRERSKQINQNFFRRVLTKLIRPDKYKVTSSHIYQFIRQHVSHPNFYYPYTNLQRSFDTWFGLVVLHIWMAYVRLRKEPNAQQLANALFIIFWDDFNATSVQTLGITSSYTLAALAKKYQLIYGGACIAYDEAMLYGDDFLASALWRNVFCQAEECNATDLAFFVNYTRSQLYHTNLSPVELGAPLPTIRFTPPSIF